MKKTLIVLSVAANIGLLVAWLGARSASPTSTSATGSNSAKAAVAAPNPDTPDPQTYDTLSAGDDLNIIAARLRAEGFSPQLQRTILRALLMERSMGRHQEFANLVNAAPWWRGNIFGGSQSDAKVNAARRQLNRDEREAIEAILGPNKNRNEFDRANIARQFGEIDPAKADEAGRILSDYSELIQEARESQHGIVLPQDAEKMAFLEREKRADLAKLLSPEEMLAYDLRNSPTANQLRYKLTAFEPTEEEFTAIFKLNQTLDDKFGTTQSMTPEQRRLRSEAETALQPSIQAMLTPERWAEYQLKTDQAYISANQIVTRYQLPATASAEVVTVQKDIEKRNTALQTDRSLTPEDRAAQRANLATEANLRLTNILGSEALTAYRSAGGYWMQNLIPPPPQPAQPAAKK